MATALGRRRACVLAMCVADFRAIPEERIGFVHLKHGPCACGLAERAVHVLLGLTDVLADGVGQIAGCNLPDRERRHCDGEMHESEALRQTDRESVAIAAPEVQSTGGAAVGESDACAAPRAWPPLAGRRSGNDCPLKMPSGASVGRSIGERQRAGSQSVPIWCDGPQDTPGRSMRGSHWQCRHFSKTSSPEGKLIRNRGQPRLSRSRVRLCVAAVTGAGSTYWF